MRSGCPLATAAGEVKSRVRGRCNGGAQRGSSHLHPFMDTTYYGLAWAVLGTVYFVTCVPARSQWGRTIQLVVSGPPAWIAVALYWVENRVR